MIIAWNDSIILAMLLTPVKWCGQMPNYSNPELIIVLLFRQLELFACNEWHCILVLFLFLFSLKDIRDGRSSLASASCCRWQTRLGFLSMPGILCSQSFLEFWKGLWASHPESASIKTHKAAGLFSLFWALFPIGCLPSNSIQMCRIQKHVCLNEIHPSTHIDQGLCFS